MTDKSPNDINAERYVLASIIIRPECIAECREYLKYPDTEWFFDPLHNEIWRASNECYNDSEPVDLMSISNRLNRDIAEQFMSILQETPTSANVGHYARIVADKFERRRLIQEAKRIAHMANDPSVSTEEIPLADIATQHESGLDEDPGYIPEELLNVGGFIGEVMEHTLAVSNYPNRYMSFCGALTMMSTLIGRKVTDLYDTHANLYVLGLAESSSGKDMPRKVNRKIVDQCSKEGHASLQHVVVNNFASKEAIEDMLKRTPTLLWQCDEMDGLLKSMDGYTNDNSRRLMEVLLELYTTSSSSYTTRLKAGLETIDTIPNPNLNLFGTCIPKNFYDSMSEKMMSNGLFGRMLVVEDNTERRPNNNIERNKNIPSTIAKTAGYWWTQGTYGHDPMAPPVKKFYEHSPMAKDLVLGIRGIYDKEYERCRINGDSMGTSVWGRAFELTNKLALIHTCSEDWQSKTIEWWNVEWACKLVDHQCRRMLFKAGEKVYGTNHEQNSNKLIEILRRVKDRTMKRSQITTKMRHLTPHELSGILDTLEEADIITRYKSTGGRGRKAETIKLR